MSAVPDYKHRCLMAVNWLLRQIHNHGAWRPISGVNYQLDRGASLVSAEACKSFYSKHDADGPLCGAGICRAAWKTLLRNVRHTAATEHILAQ
jgi:hypothetical protein